MSNNSNHGRRGSGTEPTNLEHDLISPLYMNVAVGGGNISTMYGNNPTARRPRRFFDNHSVATNHPIVPPPQQKLQSIGIPDDEISSGFRNNLDSDIDNNDNIGEKKTTNNGNIDGSLVDGMNLERLRSLTKEALGTPNVSSLPSTAVFYASLLYAKTQSQEDCFMYAQALARNGEAKRCVRLLEQSGILDSSVSDLSLRLEAVLLAAEALSTLGEWQIVLELLEDASQVALSGETNNNHSYANHYFTIEDDDDMSWDTFFQSVDQPDNYIHAVSRLCLWRGRAYSETGHPQRAAIYWKRAIRMDSKCVQALDLLLARSVVTSQEAYDIIGSLNLEEEMAWLRHLYLARIELSPQDIPEEPVHETTNANNAAHNTNSMHRDIPLHHMPSETPFVMDGHSKHLDASSIQLSSPSLIQTPRGDVLPTNANFHSMFGNDGTFVKANNPSSAQHAFSASVGPPGSVAEQKFRGKSPIQVNVDQAFANLWHIHKLQQSPEVLAMAARRAYRRYDLRGALDYCKQLAAIDPLCQTAGYVYISTLAALGHKRHLFRLAHEWVEASPKSARAWFAVGSYYYACERYHVAQRHFCRATRLDPHCTEAWIAFGCSFAACDESDQALASFRAAQRLSPGEYASLLYMGMEYLRTNHVVLAQYFLTSAFKASGGDPLCLNELGVLSIQRGDFETAISWLSRALRACVQDGLAGDERKSVADCVELCQEKHWEATIFNLGQCYRKTRKFSDAALCFERCVALSPVCFTTLFGLRFVLFAAQKSSVFVSHRISRGSARDMLRWHSQDTSWETWMKQSNCTTKRSAASLMIHLALKCLTKHCKKLCRLN